MPDPVISLRVPAALAARLSELAGSDRSISSVLREAVERHLSAPNGDGAAPPPPDAEVAAIAGELREVIAGARRQRLDAAIERRIEQSGLLAPAETLLVLKARGALATTERGEPGVRFGEEVLPLDRKSLERVLPAAFFKSLGVSGSGAPLTVSLADPGHGLDMQRAGSDSAYYQKHREEILDRLRARQEEESNGSG